MSNTSITSTSGTTLISDKVVVTRAPRPRRDPFEPAVWWIFGNWIPNHWSLIVNRWSSNPWSSNRWSSNPWIAACPAEARSGKGGRAAN